VDGHWPSRKSTNYFSYTSSKASTAVLEGLEKVADYCDKLDIALVKINDLELVTEYNLGELPALVYYRNTIPILYEGPLEAEDDLLEWLIQNRNSGDEEDVIEDVQFKSLEAMVAAVENIAVLFYNPKSTKTNEILESLETIDDDCDSKGVHFVKIADPAAAYHYGITTLPTLVYFKNSVPNLFDGILVDDQTVLGWLMSHLEAAEIEEVSQGVLGRLIRDSRNLVVIFYKQGEKEGVDVLELLESVDDDMDRLGVGMVKISEASAAKEWGINRGFGIVYFESGIPFMYQGDLTSERDLLRWVKKAIENDDIEEVNERMLEKAVEGQLGSLAKYGEHQDAAVLFFRKGDVYSAKVLKALENIDDECDENGIIFIKIGEESKAVSLGIVDLPALVYFESSVPHLYTGDLRVERDVLDWLLEQLTTDEIEEVTDEMLDALVEKNDRVLAVFCKITTSNLSSSSLTLRYQDQRIPPLPTPLYYSLAVFLLPPLASPVFLLCVTQNPVFITAIPLSQMMQRIRPRKIASLRSSPLMTISTKRTSSPSKWQTPWRREIMG